MSSKRLEGKCALITGAAGGIAIATALAFADEGAHVVVSDLDAAGAEKTAQMVAAKGTKSTAIIADVTSSKAVDAILCRAILEGARRYLDEGLRLEARLLGEVVVTRDFRIGLDHFLKRGEGRRASFVHG